MQSPTEIKDLLFKLEGSNIGKFLTQDELDVLIKHSQVTEFKPDDVILRQGKESQFLYIIIDGEVYVTARILGQGITNIETLSVGNFLGEISFIEKVPCPTSAQAKTEVQCLMINNTYFELLTTCYPIIKYKILNALSRQVCCRLKRIHDEVTDRIKNSEMASLSLFAKFVNTFNQPKLVSFEEASVVKEQLWQEPIFQFFTEAELNELFNHMELLEANKDCKLIHEGEKRASCYIVVYGAVQSSIVHDNKMAKLSVIGPGTLFAGVACVDSDSSYTVTFTTCEQAILLRLSGTVLEHLQNEKPQIWYKLYSLICTSLVALEKSIDKLDIRLHIEAYNR